MRLSSDPVCRLCRVMFCLTMLVAWLEPPQSWAQTTRPAPAERAAQAKHSFQALEDAMRQLPRETFDPAAIVQKVGNDPAALFDWVRDHTCWVPYRGSLREDKGVLMDRVGNSLDRALLLAALLKGSGHEVRLSHAQLDAGLAESLLTKIRTRPVAGDQPATRPTGEDLLAVSARKYQIDEPAMRGTLAKAVSRSSDVYQTVARRVVQQAPMLRTAAGRTKDQASADRATAVEAMRDHWWVQWHDGGAWTDLDPLPADAKPGVALAPAQQTTDPAALSDEQRQQVVVRVVIERWKDQKAQEVPVLEHAFRPSALVGREIHLNHYAPNWPGDFNAADSANIQQRLKTAVLAQHEWVPMFIVGSEPVMQSSFTDAGDVNEKPNLNPASREGGGVTGSGQGVLDAFGGNASPPAPAGAVTAEWIEYETRIPGEAPRRVRRDVFDLIGPAARAAGKAAQPAPDDAQRLRRGLALAGQTDILLCGCRPSAPYLTGIGIESLLANQKLFVALAGEDPALANPTTARPLVEQMKPMIGELEDLAYVRLLLSRYRDGEFVGRPNILTRHIHAHPNAAGQIVGCQAIDIVENEIGVRPGFDANAFDVRLAQGVIDTNLESALLTGCGQLHSAAETFAAAGNDAGKWITLRDAKDPALAQIALSPDAKARIADDLAAGCAVVVPKAPGAGFTSWWRVQPATGTTVGMGENGWGPSMVEYATLVGTVFFISFAFCVAYTAVTSPDARTVDTLHNCFMIALAAALIAVVMILIYEGFLLALGEGAAGGTGAGGASGGGGGIDPYGPTLSGGGGGGGGSPFPGGGGGPGGGGAPPVPGGGAGGGGGGAPVDPLGATSPGRQVLSGLGGLGGSL